MQQLNYKNFGEGEPLFILHGLFGSLDNWQTLGKQWAKTHSVYLIDLPNHGKSYHTDSFSYDEMATAVADLANDLALDKVTILGHSMGGKTAMNFAVNYPAKLARLIVVDIAPKPYPPHHQQILDGLFSFDPAQLTSRKEADAIMSDKIDNVGVRMFLLKNLKRKDGGGFAWKMNLSMLSEAVNHVIDETAIPHPINVDTLFIRGGMSNYILEEDSYGINEKFPLSSIETIEGAGHWVHAEKPTELLELVNEFIA